ncbi:hypothetical protein J8655_07930 [Dickeya oryzae]|uniref:hypothetical protein n=1 Tax=Dickeya oryzae TaxID=1240404 RepID=UPI001AECC25A|nr:hypothetical protein [Dickeya oryzae]MBP2845404.1 hypothetical protein [Dickeya oryzae]
MDNRSKQDQLKERIRAAEEVIGYFDSPSQAAAALECSYESIKAYRKRGLPERVALLCHISPDIPFIYDPSIYGRARENLNLVLTKPEKQ